MSHSPHLPLSPSPLSADDILSLERCHPAGHRLHSGQLELQARERRVDAGFLRGGEHLFPQVLTANTHIQNRLQQYISNAHTINTVLMYSVLLKWIFC